MVPPRCLAMKFWSRPEQDQPQHHLQEILPGWGGQLVLLSPILMGSRGLWEGSSAWGVGSSSRSSSWLCLFQTVKTPKTSGTRDGFPSCLRPFGHAVCMQVACVGIIIPARCLAPKKDPNFFLPSSYWGAELSCARPTPSSPKGRALGLVYSPLRPTRTSFYLVAF